MSDRAHLPLSPSAAARVLGAARYQEHVAGLTHTFYRYPARFSNTFARTMIQVFTKPGDTVLDPFMGGGTTIVEARAAGRRAIGTDINTLATFVTAAKTTVLTEQEFREIGEWTSSLSSRLSLSRPAALAAGLDEDHYLRNLGAPNTWRIRNLLAMALEDLELLRSSASRRVARCAVLNTGQWALDRRKQVPTASDFRLRLVSDLEAMMRGAREYAAQVRAADAAAVFEPGPREVLLAIEAERLCDAPQLAAGAAPKLVVTSPPYPGVHILYHRWQVNGGRETPAPFWVAGCEDGHGASHYTFGDRQAHASGKYFEVVTRSWASIRPMLASDSIIVQMLAFSEWRRQLPRYLAAMEQAGFSEALLAPRAGHRTVRLWRSVPSRRWYCDLKGPTPASREVVLFHQPR